MSYPHAFSPNDQLDDQECERLLALPDVGMFSLDAEGCLQEVNRFLSTLLLYPQGELRGRPLSTLSVSEPSVALLDAVTRLYADGHLRHSELPLVCRDGVRIHFEYRRLGRLTDEKVMVECRFHDLVIGTPPPTDDDRDNTDQPRVILDAEQFEQAANREIERTRDQGPPLSVLSIGIDRPVSLNGDAVTPAPPIAVRGFAVACAHLLRAADVVGRIDDGAFLLLLTNTSTIGALRAAERLRTAITRIDWPAPQRRITVSIGAVTTRTGRAAFHALRSRADAKRDDARQSGGNRVNG